MGGGYQVDESGPPTVDKDCHQVTADLEAEPPVLGRAVPRCMENGHFDLYQCQGSQCHCTDCAGLQIEGFESFGRHEADESKCSCAREKHEFERSGMVGVRHRCEPKGGHYKSYQCRGTGCYCTDQFGHFIKTEEGSAFHPLARRGQRRILCHPGLILLTPQDDHPRYYHNLAACRFMKHASCFMLQDTVLTLDLPNV